MFTVFFEDPFWVGVFERQDKNKYEVCKITFGAEPNHAEVYDFILENWNNMKFSPPQEASVIDEKQVNPKRMQREINKQQQKIRVGTKAQAVMKLQLEQGKLEKKSISRSQRETEKNYRFELRTEKQKAKHRRH